MAGDDVEEGAFVKNGAELVGDGELDIVVNVQPQSTDPITD